MGKPAARISDMTAHGGSIVMGCPTVLIGKLPAARLSDLHACPMVTPAPVPVPHVGLLITLGSAGVFIGGLPAARMGDMAACTGPPDTIVGGLPTVLIGEMGSGGGGGGGGGVASAIAGAYSAIKGEAGSEAEGPHWLESQVMDSAGNPITGVMYELTDPDGNVFKDVLSQNGVIKRGGFEKDSDYTVKLFLVYNAKWSRETAKAGDTLTLTADVDGYDDGTPAVITIWKQDIDSADVLVKEIETTVKGAGVEAEWAYASEEDEEILVEDEDRPYASPTYYFKVSVEDQETRSALLEPSDFVEIRLQDKDGKPIPNKAYRLVLPNGEIRTGKLNGAGEAREEKVPPGKCEISFVKEKK